MKSIEAYPALVIAREVEGQSAFAPVIADRIARIKARLSSGSYPVDVVALAGALVAYHDVEATVLAMTATPPTAPIVDAVTGRLAAAMRTMDGGAMLVLQLEFVEQLRCDEIAALVGSDSAAVGAVRRSALDALSRKLSEA